MPVATDNPAMARLEDQIAWYDRKSNYNQKCFKVLKVWTIAVAAIVPLLAAFGMKDPRIFAALTASIAVIEGIQQLNQYHANWIAFRSTCEALKHEKYLFLSSAGPYNGPANPVVLLAERVESLVSQEHAKWASGQQQTTQPEKETKPA